MGCLGNLLWFIFGGCISGLSWCLAGCLWCITIIGIPVGLQCFKFASLSFLRWRSRLFDFKYYLAGGIRTAACAGAFGFWGGFMYYCDRHSFWFAAV